MTKWDPNARPDSNAEAGTNSAGSTITPIEAVIDAKSTKKLHAQAEMSAQIVEERRKRASAPIRMEGLKPLPPGLPRLPNGVIPGGPDALSMTPSMRQAIPAPFQRESISVGQHGKTWAYLSVEQVAQGDMVVDFGKVDRSFESTTYEQIAGQRAATGVKLWLVNVFGEQRAFEPSDQLMVFRVHGG